MSRYSRHEDYAAMQRQSRYTHNPLTVSGPRECVRCFAANPRAKTRTDGYDCSCPACGHTWHEAFPRVKRKDVPMEDED